MFHKLQGVFPMDNFVLGCKFKSGAVKLYDVKPLMHDSSVFARFKEHPDAFYQVSVGPGGHGIVWKDDFLLTAEEAWANSWPEWDENNLTAVEIQVDPDLLRQTAERIKPFGLTVEDLAVMMFESLVYPPTQEKVSAMLLKCKDKVQF